MSLAKIIKLISFLSTFDPSTVVAPLYNVHAYIAMSAVEVESPSSEWSMKSVFNLGVIA